MKFVNSFFVCCLLVLTYSPIAYSEEESNEVNDCRQQAVELGIQEGEEFDSFVADCLEGDSAAVGTEEASYEDLAGQSEQVN